MRNILCITLLFVLTACNTMEGIGRDMRSAGEGLSDGASKVKNKINGQESR
ncbi:MAG: entericidin A/B family lipoprotein [Proteobacteria bacterium]|nr:entericidin A/B family lipoprotein [Pseudomonadota bacterium]